MTQQTDLIERLYEESQNNPDDDRWRAANALEAQAREIERLRKDAKRYAWLREALADRTGNGKSHWFCCIADGRPEELDAAIDEVIFQKGQP